MKRGLQSSVSLKETERSGAEMFVTHIPLHFLVLAGGIVVCFLFFSFFDREGKQSRCHLNKLEKIF